MKKAPKTPALTVGDMAKAARKASRDAEIARGWKPRAQTFADRKKKADRNACRGRWAA